MQTDDTLISYNLLKQRIIDRGFCTLCGACEAACPTTALHIEKNQVVRLHDCSQDLVLCPICYELCPHSERLLLRALHFISDAPKKDDALGYYRTVILAQAANPKLHGKSRGGGVAAALIEYGVGKQLFDSTIYSQDKTNNHVNVLTSAEYFEDDVLASFRTDLFTSSVAKAYGKAVFEYKKRKIAYVGLPCHTLALRKMEAWQHKFSNNLAISIGLFCFGALSYTSLLAYITKKTGIQASEIVNMRLSSDLIVQTADREIRLPISEVEDYL
ncbi:MAG: 4Fe-4S binding protein, partial [Crenarchaeota archaeon]|nr:4Fe-4S binding protein [Thermoproteota archaeon]